MLLLDEPLSNLDAKLRVEMRGEIRQLQKPLGITALYVTHDQEEALAISDRIAVMRAGRLEQVGVAGARSTSARNAVRREFMGTTNLLDGTVRGTGRRDARSRSAAACCGARRAAASRATRSCSRCGPRRCACCARRGAAARLGDAVAARSARSSISAPVTRFARHARRRHAAASDGALDCRPRRRAPSTVAYDPRRVVVHGAPP